MINKEYNDTILCPSLLVSKPSMYMYWCKEFFFLILNRANIEVCVLPLILQYDSFPHYLIKKASLLSAAMYLSIYPFSWSSDVGLTMTVFRLFDSSTPETNNGIMLEIQFTVFLQCSVIQCSQRPPYEGFSPSKCPENQDQKSPMFLSAPHPLSMYMYFLQVGCTSTHS